MENFDANHSNAFSNFSKQTVLQKRDLSALKFCCGIVRNGKRIDKRSVKNLISFTMANHLLHTSETVKISLGFKYTNIDLHISGGCLIRVPPTNSTFLFSLFNSASLKSAALLMLSMEEVWLQATERSSQAFLKNGKKSVSFIKLAKLR